MVRIVSWNVNGVRTLRPSFKSALDSLNADIICLQETRIGHSDADLERYALVQGYHSFFSFCKTRRGYSGVATFTRTPSYTRCPTAEGTRNSTDTQRMTHCSCPNVTPLDACEGFVRNIGGASVDWLEVEPPGFTTGASDVGTELRNILSKDGTCRETVPAVVSAEDLDLMRDEGRVVVTDHGRFVLINIYAPAVSDEERMPFKLAFNRALERKVRSLRDAKRNIVVAGDFNIAPSVQDVAEVVPDIKAFERGPSRSWLRSVMMRELDLVDSFREAHPGASEAYTCWSEATQGRENNFGVRIDLIMMSSGLYHHDVLDAYITPQVQGSDHCPIGVVLRDEPFLGTSLPERPPQFCSKYLKRFSSKQASIRSFVSQAKTSDGVDKSKAGGDIDVSCEELGVSSGKPTTRTAPFSSRPATDGTRKRPRCRTDQSRIGMYFQPVCGGSERVDKRGDGVAQMVSTKSRFSTSTCHASVAASEQETVSAEEQESMKSKWRKILTGPPEPPLCRHRERCKLKVVKKSGENKGRTFYSCARPAGHWPRDREANCNYFEWAPYSAGSTMASR